MTDPGLSLGLDLGTSGCRACVLDAAGRRRAFAAVAWSGPFQDPETWWTGVLSVLDMVCREVVPGALQSLAVDGTSGTVLATDGQGTPVGPALRYDDARARAQAEAIARVAPPDSGAHGASSGLAKALWIAARDTGKQIRHVLSQADWITFRLGAPLGVSDDNNALKLGWDPLQQRWPRWIEALGLPRAWLPRVHRPGTPLGTVHEPLARRFGLSPGVRIVAGTTDSVAATLAAGVRQPGEAVTVLGSTLVLKVLSPRPVHDPAHGVYSHRLGEHWLAGGASNTGGAVLRRFFDPATLERLSRALEPDRPTGLDYYPLLRPGERFPVADPGLAPRLDPRPKDPARFLQGLLESMARIEARGYRLLHALGAPYPRRVYTTGGGATNPAWTRIRSRILGVPVVPAQETEAACGVAQLGRLGVTARHGPAARRR